MDIKSAYEKLGEIINDFKTGIITRDDANQKLNDLLNEARDYDIPMVLSAIDIRYFLNDVVEDAYDSYELDTSY